MEITKMNDALYSDYMMDTSGRNAGDAVTNKQKSEKVYSNTREYKTYLTDKYDCLKSKDYSVTVDSSLMAKAATDEKTAQWLEYNLALIPETVEKTKAIVEARGSRVISHSIKINGYDSMSAELCTVAEADSGAEKATENQEKKLERIREEKKKTKEKAEKKAEQEHIEKLRTEKVEAKQKTEEVTISAIGTDVKSITSQLINGISSGITNGTVGFDPESVKFIF